MAISIKGLRGQDALRKRATTQMRAVIEPLQVAPVSAQVTFFDDDGPRGGRAVRCALTVRVPYRPSVRVEHTAVTTRLAFDGAFPALERLLERYRERARDNRRHPKKYFVARRLLTSS